MSPNSYLEQKRSTAVKARIFSGFVSAISLRAAHLQGLSLAWKIHRWNPLLKCSEAFTKALKKKMMFLMNTQLRTTSQRKLLCFDNFIESELELTNLRHVEETVFSFGVRSWSPSWSHSGTNWNKNHLCIKSSTSTFIYFRSEAYISFKLFEHPLLQKQITSPILAQQSSAHEGIITFFIFRDPLQRK